jgi:hypothetical protein
MPNELYQTLFEPSTCLRILHHLSDRGLEARQVAQVTDHAGSNRDRPKFTSGVVFVGFAVVSYEIIDTVMLLTTTKKHIVQYYACFQAATYVS